MIHQLVIFCGLIFMLFVATPILDFIPILEEVMFTEGQSVGGSACADITIIQDIFVEMQETFEVMLLPDPNNFFGALINPGTAKAIVTISDGQMDRSMCIYCIILYYSSSNNGMYLSLY